MHQRLSGLTARTVLVLTLAAMPACRTWPADGGVPAVVTHPGKESRADLQLAVSRAFGGTPVTLAHDALTRDSLLIVGRSQARDVRGVPLNGRELGRPQHFRLLLRGSQCVLLHVETGRSRALPHTTCRALPPPPGNRRDGADRVPLAAGAAPGT